MKDLGKLSSFCYDMPLELIATHAVDPRDSARLLVVNGHERGDYIFRDLGCFLSAGDLLIINDVRVQACRFYCQRQSGGLVEFFIVDDISRVGVKRFGCLWKSGKKLCDGEVLGIVGSEEKVRFFYVEGGGEVEFLGEEMVVELLSRLGELPLPPYILKRRVELGGVKYEMRDGEDYQTVYAQSGAAAAAPTAGLHFTENLLRSLKDQGVCIGRLRLDVGLGTFQPIREEELSRHVMHKERYIIEDDLCRQVKDTQNAGGRIVAVGTTVVRSLEDQYQRFGELRSGVYETDIFIKVGYRFGMIDKLVTNFHLSGSTLLVLVCAFGGYDAMMEAYAHAVREGYRFYSYGDAMLIDRG